MILHTGCGLEPWRRVGELELTRWDLWYLMVLVKDCGGSWDDLATRLRSAVKDDLGGFAGRDWEAKRSHMEALRTKLEAAGIAVGKLLGPLAGSKPVLYKARKKLFGGWLPDSYKTQDMLATPRRRLRALAMRGQWERFPVNPAVYEQVYTGEIGRRSFYGEMASLGLSNRLETRLRRAARERGVAPARLLALYRSGLTVLLEAMERNSIDDSFGVIGDFYQEVLKKYFEVRWGATGIAAEAYYRDFLELATWEDYGFMHEQLGPFFQATQPEHVPLVDSILISIREELLRHEELGYQAERARALLHGLHKIRETAPAQDRRKTPGGFRGSTRGRAGVL